jgi:GMP synthase (glutamine-hydrolysing)
MRDADSSGKVLILEQEKVFLPKTRVGLSFGRLFVEAGGLRPEERELADMESLEAAKKDPRRFAGLIITGSLGMASERRPWMKALLSFTEGAVEAGRPVFGVCFGHHVLAQVHGGEVDFHPGGPETGRREIRLDLGALSESPGEPETGDSLAQAMLRGFPEKFHAHLAHSQTISVKPKTARTLASSAHDPHQILEYGPRTLSCQFHPEFDESVMSLFLREEVEAGGPEESVEPILSPAPGRRSGRKEGDAVSPASLIRRFVDFALRNRTASDRAAQSKT